MLGPPRAHGEYRKDDLSRAHTGGQGGKAPASNALQSLFNRASPGICGGREEAGLRPSTHQRQPVELIREANWAWQQQDNVCTQREGPLYSSTCSVPFAIMVPDTGITTLDPKGVGPRENGQQQQVEKPICTITITPATPERGPSKSCPRRPCQAQDYFSFLTSSPTGPQVSSARGGVDAPSGGPQTSSRLGQNAYVGMRSVREPEAPNPGAPGTSIEEAAAHAGASLYRSPRGRRRRPAPLNFPEETNRRVRFWWSRGPHSVPTAVGGPPSVPSAAGATHPLPAGMGKLQRTLGPRTAAAALEGPPGSCIKRGGTPEKVPGRVTFAPGGLRSPLRARRACSSCVKTVEEKPAAPEAATPAAPGGSNATAAARPTATRQQRLSMSSLQVPPPEGGPRGGPPRAPAGLNAGPTRVPNQQQAGEGTLTSLETQPAGMRPKTSLSMEEKVEPLAADGVSLAATRAAAVAKAAAAVAAAAQAEVEAAAAVASAWGSGKYTGSCSALSTEQRREQLMLVLRLLLLLPPELQHAIQARLFMLQQQQHRWASSAANPWPKRAATTANLPATLGVSGAFGTSWKPQRQQHHAVAAATPAPEALAADPRETQHTSSSSNSSSSSSTATASSIQQQQDPHQQHPQHSAADPTVNGLLMSATLQASAVLQMTPGGNLGERNAANTAAAAAATVAAAAGGESTAQVSASCRAPSCRCRTAASGGPPYRAPLPSLPLPGRSSLLPQQQQQQQQLQLSRRQAEDYLGGGPPLGPQQPQQDAQSQAEGGGPGRSSCLGAHQSSCCRPRRSTVSQQGEALWMIDGHGAPQGAPGPPWVGGCRGCAATVATIASSGSCRNCSGSRGGQARPPSCLQQQHTAAASVAGICRPQQLLCCGSTASHLSNTGALQPSGAIEYCRGLPKGSCSKGPPSAGQQQQQQAAREEATAGAPATVGDGGPGGSAMQPCNWAEGSPGPSAVELRLPTRWRGQQQQRPRQAVAVHPSQMMGLRMWPCSSSCNSSSSSTSCRNQGLLQLHLSSLPSLFCADPSLRPCSTATDLNALPDSHNRLLLPARSRRGAPMPPMALVLSPHTDSSNTISSSSTDSSHTATSNSLSDTSRSKEAQVEKAPRRDAKGASPLDASPPGDPDRQHEAAAAAAVAASVAAAALGCTRPPRVETEEVREQRLPVLLPPGLECPPSSPEGGRCSSPDCCSSPALTLEASSPRADKDELIASTGGLSDSIVGALADPTDDLAVPAIPWSLPPALSIETLPASSVCGFPPLPDAGTNSSGTSLKGPASLFFSSTDPRGYDGPLVKSALISVETLPATVMLPSLAGPPTHSIGGPLAPRHQQHQNAPPLLQLHVLPLEGRSPRSDPALRLQKQPQRHPSSCPNLHRLEASSSAEKLLGELVCGVSWRPKDAGGLLASRKRAGSRLPIGCCQATSCLRRHSSLSLASPRQGGPMRGPIFAEEPLQCTSPPEGASTPGGASPVAAAIDAPPASRLSSSAGRPLWGIRPHGVVQGPHINKTQEEKTMKTHDVGRSLAERALERLPDNRCVCRLSSHSAVPRRPRLPLKKAATATVAATTEGNRGTADGERLGEAKRLSEEWQPPIGVDWRTSEIATALDAHVAHLLRPPCSQGTPLAQAALLNTLGGMGDDCPAETREAAEFLISLAMPQLAGHSRPSAGKKIGYPSAPVEGALTELLQASQLFNILGLDVEHSIPGGPSDILRAASEAQQKLARQHQEEMNELSATAARLKRDSPFSSVLPLYADAIQRACHRALQRAVRASRAASSLQLADEERVKLLCRFHSEMMRLCTAAEKLQFQLATDDENALSSPPKQPPTVSLIAEPVPLVSDASGPSLNRRAPGALSSAETEICLPSVPELLLLNDPGGVRERIASLHCLAEAARDVRGGDRACSRLAPKLFENREHRVTGNKTPRASPVQIQLTGDALENFASNKHLVSTFLNQFASWQFEASESFEPEVSFLKQLQEEFADVTSSGVQMALPKFVVQRREAAFRSLPPEVASSDHIKELLQPVARHAAARLPPPETLLQQQITTSVELLLNAPPAPLGVSSSCSKDQISSWLETLMSSLSCRADAPVPPPHVLPLAASPGGLSVDRRGQAALAMSQASNNASWSDNIHEVENLVEAKLEQLREACSASLQDAAKALEGVMQQHPSLDRILAGY